DDGHALCGAARRRSAGPGVGAGPRSASRRAGGGVRRAAAGRRAATSARDDGDRAARARPRGPAPDGDHASRSDARGVLHHGARRGLSVRRGFVDPVLGSQRVFRCVLEAMAHPARIVTLDALLDAPASLAPASAAVCLTLLDFETPLWLDDAARAPEAMEWLRFHCGVPLVDQPEAARFALVLAPATMPENDEFDAGNDAMPDLSATLILQVDALEAGAGTRLAGPGIADTTRLEVRGTPARFWDLVRDNAARFPRGVDLLLTSGRRLAALPRTVRVKDD